MKRTILGAVLLACATMTLGLSGCGSDTGGGNKPQGGTSNGTASKGGNKDSAEMQEVKVNLAKLSDEDRASAEKQKICPVSGKLLGSMDAPEKVDVDGQPVWICCGGCESELLKDPDTYLAKLKQE